MNNIAKAVTIIAAIIILVLVTSWLLVLIAPPAVATPINFMIGCLYGMLGVLVYGEWSE